jgi:isoquinoline 1-oxidoreductase beta subunit
MTTRSGTGIGRRTLLKGGLAMGAGLVVGFRVAGRAGDVAEAQTPGVLAPNQWLRIDRDGIVTITNSVPEMGQGTSTTMPMIVADELDAEWERIRVEQAPANPKLYGNPGIGGQQLYGGSHGIRSHLQMWRKAGAAARQMLREAAAQEWGVPLSEVDTEPGAAVHRPTGRRLPYGQLVDRAQALPVPADPPLKTKDKFRYIGKDRPRLDVPSKVNGRAVYGSDVKVPGMLIASIERSPVVARATVKRFDATAAKAVPGVKQVVQVTNGVAVVADSFWAAQNGRKALVVEWDDGPVGAVGSDAIAREYETLAGKPGVVARNDGDVDRALAGGGRTLEAVYRVPFLEHACMEPMNATAHVTREECTVWAPTQNPGGTQAVAARITGLPPERVTVHTMFMGGGFGRRNETDFVVDAVEVAKAVGVPVKTLWTREDDLTHGFYRPTSYNVVRAALDAQGQPVGWFTRAVGAGLLTQRGAVQPTQVDGSALAALRDLPYDIPNLRIEWVHRDMGVPVGFWRSVASSQNAFVVESFVDELAHAAGKDPFEYRRALLGKAPRHKGVLELAAARAGWGTPLPAGRARGIAVCFSYGSYAAHVAEVSVDDAGAVTVHRVVAAIDCGLAVHPDQVRAQMEGGVVYALTAVLHGDITLDRGRVQQTNFHTYPMLRMAQTPRTEVHILDSGEAPGGIGEPGVPTVAPAVCNAIFAATGKRVRRLPIRTDELKKA